jgi:hypothetical protein
MTAIARPEVCPLSQQRYVSSHIHGLSPQFFTIAVLPIEKPPGDTIRSDLPSIHKPNQALHRPIQHRVCHQAERRLTTLQVRRYCSRQKKRCLKCPVRKTPDRIARGTMDDTTSSPYPPFNGVEPYGTVRSVAEERAHRKRMCALGYRIFGALRWGMLGDGHISAVTPS